MTSLKKFWRKFDDLMDSMDDVFKEAKTLSSTSQGHIDDTSIQTKTWKQRWKFFKVFQRAAFQVLLRGRTRVRFRR